jgi:hypothetical protein
MRYTQEQITSWVKEYEGSGQSISDFVKGKPFHPSTLSYWLSKRKDTSSFIEITPKSNPNSTIEIRRSDGVVVCINKPISISEIIQLVKC